MKIPDGAVHSIDNSSNAELFIIVDLLNPSEEVSVGLTVADANMSDLKISVRSEGLIVRESSPSKDRKFSHFVDMLTPIVAAVFLLLVISTTNIVERVFGIDINDIQSSSSLKSRLDQQEKALPEILKKMDDVPRR